MNLDLEREAAAKALQTVAAFTGREPPAYRYLLLQASDEALQASANSQYGKCTIPLPGSAKETGEVRIQADALVGLALRSDAKKISLSQAKAGTILKSGTNRYRLPVLSGDDSTLAPAKAAGGYAMPAELFCAMLGFAAHAMAKNDVRYFLNGACITLAEMITVATSDSHRAAFAVHKPESTVPEELRGQVIVPHHVALKLLSALEPQGEVVLALDNSSYTVSANLRFEGLGVEGQYPKIEPLLQVTGSTAKVSRQGLIATLERAALLLSSERLHKINLELGAGKLHLSFANSTADLDEWLAAEQAADERAQKTVNPHYLLEAAAAMPDDDLIMTFPEQSEKPLRLDAAQTPGRTCIVMGMRD